jgi:hypothetical protein
MRLRFVTGFIGLLNVLITLHSGAIANAYSLQLPTVNTESSQSAVPSRALWFRNPTADVPFREFPNCPRATATDSKSRQLHCTLFYNCLHFHWLRPPVTQLLSKSKLYYDRWSVGQSVLVSDTHRGTAIKFPPFYFNFFLDSYGVVDVGRPL